MKSKLIYSLVFICLWTCIFFAIIQVTAKKGNDLSLTIWMTAQLDDQIELFYRKEGERFTKEQKIAHSIKGGNKFKELTFQIPSDASHLRIDFSAEPTQEAVFISSMEFSFGNEEDVKQVSYNAQEIIKHFKTNGFLESIRMHKNRVVIVPKSINGKYDPFFFEKKISNLFLKDKASKIK